MTSSSRRRRSPARAAALAAALVLAVLGAPAAIGFRALLAQDEATLRATAQDRARLVLSVVPEASAGAGVEELVRTARTPGVVEVVVVVGGEEVASTTAVSSASAPDSVLLALDRGEESLGTTAVAGRRAVVAGAAEGDAGVLVFASAAPLEDRAAGLGVRATAVLLLVALLAAVAEAVRARAALREEQVARDRERELTADMAHELRGPVSTLVTAASLVEPGLDDLPATAREPMVLVLSEAQRLRQLVEDMLQLSRLEEGDGDVDLDDVDLSRLVRSVLAVRGWEGAVAHDPVDDVVVTADRRVLARIVVNLVENALRHGGGAPVRVDARVGAGAARGRAVLAVEDEGPGVPPERRERVFDRFSSTAGGSSGLGLALVRAGAEAMGGGARMEEGRDGGARVVVELPLAPRGPRGPAPDPAARRAPAGPAA
ncbi:sensor histidine kinase KdpD [uncultured Pseudokineococcus sp.]|uniref:sensor histidine kinase n=1 Tax=uncultured Pseudokineococcus sp. TaxID=1642928 RepID=UPI00262F18C5|nr:HAMP domain-containing sensor histidine kinase [uncultured Pseudokineococcus sp.]